MTRYYVNGREVNEAEWSDDCESNIREMLDSRRPPMSTTDREFLEGFCNGSQFEDQPWIGDMYRREAVAAGVDITGKRYMHSLADFPGDPTAWVSDRGDVRRVAEEKGMGCSGAVNVKARELASAPVDAPLADDIVGDKVCEILGGLPEAERPHVDTADLAEQVREALSPHWSK